MPGAPAVYDPSAIVELAPMNDTLATVTTIYEATLPETVAVLPAVAVIAGGAYLETKLLQNEKWDNFWIGVGGHLSDAWSAAGHFLFGHGEGVTLTQVAGLIRLSMHINMRATRQLITGGLARTAAVEGALVKGVKAVATTVRNLTAWTASQLNRLRADMNAGDAAARRYAEGLAHNVGASIDARIGAQVNALRAEMIRDILNPMRSAEADLEKRLHDARVRLASMESDVAHHLRPDLNKATLIAGAALALGKAAKAWEDDCGEPMCQTVGPRTDWGKLLRRFGPTAIFALLAAIAAENPKAVEGVATELADALGPALSTWAESWLGLAPGDRDAIGRKAGDTVGHFPGLPG